MYTGSMYGAGCNVFAVWGYALASADEKGFVELNPKMLASMLGGTTEEITGAIDYLCRPDPDSRTSREKGRRITREGQFMYKIVNYEHYRRIRNEEERREYQREWARQKRQKE